MSASAPANHAAIIYKKLAHGFYFVIPTTTKSKVGSWFVPFRQADRDMVASLHQARAIDHRRLSTKLGQLDDADFQKVREGNCSPLTER